MQFVVIEHALPFSSLTLFVAVRSYPASNQPHTCRCLCYRHAEDSLCCLVLFVQALAKDVSLQLRDHIDQTARAPQGKTWIRGWDDWNKASEAPVEPSPQLK